MLAPVSYCCRRVALRVVSVCWSGRRAAATSAWNAAHWTWSECGSRRRDTTSGDAVSIRMVPNLRFGAWVTQWTAAPLAGGVGAG